ncbi:universal stress protein [Kitasatospora sp. NPDC018058]|uniref:universal stress protein n=1 Tax=Kitasatospora sp. NPDC018058 TaxID=3364025 RepID=UPI0037BFFA03
MSGDPGDWRRAIESIDRGCGRQLAPGPAGGSLGHWSSVAERRSRWHPGFAGPADRDRRPQDRTARHSLRQETRIPVPGKGRAEGPGLRGPFGPSQQSLQCRWLRPTRTRGRRHVSEQTGPEQRIVVGVDGSSASVDALRWAVGQARMQGAVVEALMAWQHPVATGWTVPIEAYEDLSGIALSLRSAGPWPPSTGSSRTTPGGTPRAGAAPSTPPGAASTPFGRDVPPARPGGHPPTWQGEVRAAGVPGAAYPALPALLVQRAEAGARA